MVEEREGARRRWLYQFDLRTKTSFTCRTYPHVWVVATAPRYFIHTAEFFTVYLRRGTCDLRLEKQPGSLPLRCRRRRRRRRRVYSVGEAGSVERGRLPRDAYVLSDSQPIRDVLCGSANWACPQWGCGASCCAQCLHSAERSVFSGGAVRAARSAYAGTLDVCCARGAGVRRRSGSGEKTGIFIAAAFSADSKCRAADIDDVRYSSQCSSPQTENFQTSRPSLCPATLPDG